MSSYGWDWNGTVITNTTGYKFISGSGVGGIVDLDGKKLSEDDKYKEFGISSESRIDLSRSTKHPEFRPQIVDVRNYGSLIGNQYGGGRDSGLHNLMPSGQIIASGMTSGFFATYQREYNSDNVANTITATSYNDDLTVQTEMTLYNYSASDSIKVGFTIINIATPKYESPFDVFAIRVRARTKSASWNNNEQGWIVFGANMSNDHIEGGDGWDCGPHAATIYGGEIKSLAVNDPYEEIIVEVQAANCYGVSEIVSNEHHPTSETVTVYAPNGTSFATRQRITFNHPERKIHTVVNLDNAIITQKKRYIDFIKARIQGPSNTGEEVKDNDISVHPISKLLVYARKKRDDIDDSNTNGRTLVYRYNAVNNKERHIIMNLAHQNSDSNHSNNKAYANNKTIDMAFFEPDTEYVIWVYYTIRLDDKNLTNKDVELTQLVGQTRSKHYSFTIKTLPMSKIFTNRLVSGVSKPYEYIFGKSQLKNVPPYKSGDYESMHFRTTRQINNVDSSADLVNNKDNVWKDNYDQIRPMRITLTAKKGSTTATIQRTYQKSARTEQTDTTAEKSFAESYKFDWRSYYPEMHLSQADWDKLYRVFPSNKDSNPNELQVEVSVETKGSFDNWYKNDAGTKKITIKLTGIEPTAHVNPTKSLAPTKRAYVWVNPTKTDNGKAKRGVMWANPTKNETQDNRRCI